MAIINGTPSGETLDGTAADDTINGFAGADRLFGFDGNDTLIGGAGTDLLNGGAGNDTASYFDSTAGVFVSLALATQQNTIGAGNDTLVDIENLTGSAFNDRFVGNAADNILDGLDGVDIASYEAATVGVVVDLGLTTAQNTIGAGTDTLRNIESLIGSAFDDTLAGTSGNNNLNGGSGNDTVSYASALAAVVVSLAITAQQDSFGAGRDTLVSIENLTGSSFNDRLFGDVGDNILDGLAGIDTISYAGNSAGVTVDLGRTTAQNTVGAGNDTLRNFENLTGSSFDDILSGDGTDNVIGGGAGNDTVSYAAALAAVVVSLAITDEQDTFGAGRDTIFAMENLTGSAFNDRLAGNDGDNILDGLAGIDVVTYAAATAGVVVDLGLVAAQNTIGAGTDTLRNIESLIGSSLDDILSGNGGNNSLNGGTGNDTLSYAGALAAVTVSLAITAQQDTLGAGRDTIFGIENLTGSAFNDRLTGTSSDNVLDGLAGIDTLSYAGTAAGVIVDLGLTTAQNTVGAGTDTLRNFENLTGTSFDDVLSGDNGNNTINGGAGNDTVAFSGALAGVIVSLAITAQQDTLGAGKDTIFGFENLTGSAFNDRLTGSTGDNILDGLGGIDTAVYAGAASGVTVSLALTGAQDTLGAGVDTLRNFENLTGSAFDDVLAGNASDNVISGGGGRDTADYAAASAAVRVDLNLTVAQDTLGAGTDTLFSIENVAGSDFADHLFGNAGDNTLAGGKGDDTLTGGGGNDQINGGDGSDTAVFSGLRADYNLVIGGNTVTVTDLRASPNDGVDTVVDVAFLRFSDATIAAFGIAFTSPSAFSIAENSTQVGTVAATKPGPVNPGPTYTIAGGADAARFTINAATGALAFLTAPDFEIPADAGGNNVYDVVIRASDSFTATQAIAVTVLDISDSPQQFTGTSAADVFAVPGGSASTWTLSGLGGIDTLTGSGNADVIIGGKGNDILAGGDGSDVFQFATGDGLDRVDGGVGFDRIIATKANAAIGLSAVISIEAIDANGFAGVRIVGGTAADTLDFSGTALTGIASISGLGGADILTGSTTADRIIGGAGRDVLAGNGGADTFVFERGTDSGLGAARADVILDFTVGSDIIDLSGIDANASIAGNDAFTFIGTAAFTGLGQLRVGTDSNGKVALFANIGGNTTAELQISFDNNAAIAVTDLIL